MSAHDSSPPEPLSAGHALDRFECGEKSLDDWLRKRALKNQGSGASRCFVICEGNAVIGYYSLSAGAIHHEAAPKPMRRNMPDPLPVLLLGRLAIDQRLSKPRPGPSIIAGFDAAGRPCFQPCRRIRHVGSCRLGAGQAVLPLAWLRRIAVATDDAHDDIGNGALDPGRTGLTGGARSGAASGV
jgi:hypothetical protein